MVAKSKIPHTILNFTNLFILLLEPKSKRLTTRHRAKIDRKARETHRKQRKEAKKGNGGVFKRRKDPGVPSMIPMREQLLEKMREERAKELAQKAARKALHFGSSAAGDEDEDMEDSEPLSEEALLASMVQNAQAASESFTPAPEASEFADASLNIDSSRRAFYREFKEVFENSDVILMVLDARDPQGCRVKEVEESVLATGGKKRLVMVLNKIDLVPRENVQGWIKYIQREFPCVAFKASTQEGRTHLSHSSSTTGSEAYGADGLLQLLKNYARSGNLNKKLRVRVGVVGYPNVGKSSLINSLKRSRVCNVGATPGVTTARQEIHLDSTVSLIDCPGIVFNHQAEGENASLMLRNCLKVEQLADPITPALEALSRIQPAVLQRLYALPETQAENSSALLAVIAKRLGKLKRGGVPDLEATARHILNDWNNGKIAYYTPVPTDKAHLLSHAEIVTDFAPRFNFDSDHVFEDSTMDTREPECEPVDSSITDSSSIVKQVRKQPVVTTETSDKSEASESYDSEDEVNYQVNQQNAKNLKAAQKKQAKQARRAMQQ